MMFEETPKGNGSLVDENQLYLGVRHQAKGKPGASGTARLSARQEANDKCDLPRKSLNRYSWQEIQRHSQETHQWLVINRKVYDVTGWADRHPGGRKVLSHYAGEDAMSQLVDDFQELRRTLETVNLFNANLGFFSLHLAQILILEALAWVIVWHFSSGWLVTMFISCLLTVAQAQSGFLQHDMAHLSIFKKSKWNCLMQNFVMGHLQGLSAKWWNNQHFQHHVKTNIYPKDPDIDVEPFLVIGDLQPVKYSNSKIKFINYEKQHLYFCMVGVPLLIPVAFNLKSMQEMYRRRYWEDIAWVSSSYIRYFITFGPFYGIFGTLMLICLVKFLESPWITYITQMSHIPVKMSKEENQDWFSTQVLATCNVEQSFFNDWFTGHLNFQTEHQ